MASTTSSIGRVYPVVLPILIPRARDSLIMRTRDAFAAQRLAQIPARSGHVLVAAHATPENKAIIYVPSWSNGAESPATRRRSSRRSGASYARWTRTYPCSAREALGAQPREVMRMTVRESLVPVLFGAGIGLAGALALTRLVSGMLYGVAPGDPLSMLTAAAAILARRASRVDPMSALRWE